MKNEKEKKRKEKEKEKLTWPFCQVMTSYTRT